MQLRARVGVATFLIGATLGGLAACVTEPEVPPAGEPLPEPAGEIRVRTGTGGTIETARIGYLLLIDDVAGPSIGANDSATVGGLAPGDHLVELSRVTSECLVDGSNPRVVTVGQGTSSTFFRLVCTGPNLTLKIVSGDGQAGRPGEALAEPLVVQVTDDAGAVVEGVGVVWTVTGEGTLASSFSPQVASPVETLSTSTDSDGLARVPVMPLGFEVLEVHAGLRFANAVTFRVDATDPRASLSVVSGSDQPATAGQPLDEPFVVRLTDGGGDPVPHVTLAWQVESGDGDLGRDLDGTRLLSVRTRTDTDGLATVVLTPTWFGPVTVSASVNGVSEVPATFMADATDLRATLAIVSGDSQDGKAGEALSEPFVVVVTDGDGEPAPNVLVAWSSADGRFDDHADMISDSGSSPLPWRKTSGYTDRHGVARMRFSPVSLGTVEVNARLGGSVSNATFTTEVNVLVIFYWSIYWGYGPAFDSVTDEIPLGTRVEWVSRVAGARIVSTSRPLDGAGFDSGVLARDERFEFTPGVVGTWEYLESEWGVTGTLRVY